MSSALVKKSLELFEDDFKGEIVYLPTVFVLGKLDILLSIPNIPSSVICVVPRFSGAPW